MSWQDDAGRDLVRRFGPRMEMFVRGEGAYLWDADGRRYLDFLAGIAVNSLGHAHPVFVEAIATQAATLAHVSNYFATPRLELASRLKRLAGTGDAGRVYFGNSGAEANEAAFKLARLHGAATDGAPARPRILALTDAFHRRTMGTLALTGKPYMQEPFLPMVPGVEFIDSTIEALEAALDDRVAALFVEPMGEAGVIDLPDGYLEAARELTEKHGALLIVDEIQTGAGPAPGEWFAFQHAGITPDAITVAKGIGGGFPIGALITFGHASELFYPGTHGSTFGGNALGTAVSSAVLGEIEDEGLAPRTLPSGAATCARRSRPSTARCWVDAAAPVCSSAWRCEHPVAKAVVAAAHEHGLIINAPNDETVRLVPALNIGDVEVDEFVQLFTASLRTVEDALVLDAASEGVTA